MQEIPSAKTESKQIETPLYTPEFIEKLKRQAQKAIEMEADIKTVISVFGEVMDSFGLKEIPISGGANEIQSVLPVIVGKLSREMMMGTFDTQAFANITAVMPIIEKYKHLADE